MYGNNPRGIDLGPYPQLPFCPGIGWSYTRRVLQLPGVERGDQAESIFVEDPDLLEPLCCTAYRAKVTSRYRREDGLHDGKQIAERLLKLCQHCVKFQWLKGINDC